MLSTNKAYFFKKGKDYRYISYDEFGKIMIAKNCYHEGYYRVLDALEKDKCYIVRLSEELLFDYYDGMSYDRFKRLLMGRGYKIAYELSFEHIHHSSEVTDEFQLIAYNANLNIVIKAETFTYPETGEKTFNAIECYCFGTNYIIRVGPRTKFLSYGSSECTVFNIAYHKNYVDPLPLHFIETYASPDAKKGTFDILSAATYVDYERAEFPYEKFKQKFYKLIPDELKAWFRHA